MGQPQFDAGVEIVEITSFEHNSAVNGSSSAIERNKVTTMFFSCMLIKDTDKRDTSHAVQLCLLSFVHRSSAIWPRTMIQ